MRLGFFLPHIGPWAGPDSLARVAKRAEEIGFDSVWVTERSLLPLEPQTPYPLGDLPDVYKQVLDPCGSLAFVAAQTSRVRLGTSILNLPWYSPVLLARQLTTLDVLGRQVGIPRQALRGGASGPEDDLDDRPGRVRRGLLHDSTVLHRPQARAETAPADLHGGVHTGDDGAGGALGGRLAPDQPGSSSAADALRRPFECPGGITSPRAAGPGSPCHRQSGVGSCCERVFP